MITKMNSDESLSILLSKQDPSKNEEMGKFEKIINTFNPAQEPINKIYIDIFNGIVEKRLKLISEPEPDYLYLWKALQALRILSRNKNIQNEIYKESHLSMYFHQTLDLFEYLFLYFDLFDLLLLNLQLFHFLSF